MENWGLTTFRTTDLLFDQHASDQKYHNRILYVVAHELAHQWFGNLVTMDWWDELWLNEGFATWAGWYAVDHLHPEWNVWGQFITQSMQMAFKLDGLRASHPIEVPVKNALEVNQIFDHISYLKGSSVIRMLVDHLGVETFLRGVSNYFEEHQYSNARTSDLWSALSQVSGQDVKAFMDPWILNVGFPVVTVVEEPGQLIVKQSRFLNCGNVEPEENQTTWWIPIGLKTGLPATETRREHFATREEIYLDVDTNFYKVNNDQSGFYRTNLPAQRLVSLSTILDKLSVQDKIGLIGDATALAISGNGTTAGVLAFLERFSNENNYFVWSEIFSSLDKLRSVFADDKELSEGLSKYTLRLVTDATNKIGWEFGPHDSYFERQLRALLLLNAGLAGHEGVVTEARKRFDAFASGDNKAIHPSLRSTVYKIGVKNGGKPAHDTVKNEYLVTTSIDGREIALQSLGKVQTAELAREYLQFGFSNKVAIQDVHSVGVSLANNSEVRGEVWRYTKANWDMIRERLGCKMVVLERFVRLSLQEFASFEIGNDIEGFFETKDNIGYDRALAVVGDTIKSNARYRDSNAETTREWLLDYGYLERQKI
jgi:aminopeptidase N